MNLMRISLLAVVLFGVSAALPTAAAADDLPPFDASAQATQLDPQIDWSRISLIVVQDGGRYKTLDSFAREAMAEMHGAEHLPGLSPMASLLEWLFNADAYMDAEVIRIKDRGLRVHFSTQMAEKDRRRIQATGYMTPRELLDPVVQQRIRELEPRFDMIRAIGRVRSAQAIATALPRLMKVVPDPDGTREDPWYTIDDLRPNAALLFEENRQLPPEEIRQRFGVPVAGITPEQAAGVVGPWQQLKDAWQAGDVAAVQQQIDTLAQRLPALAAAGVYPDRGQRAAEVQYYAWGKFTWPYVFYFLGMIVSVWALLTRWKTPLVVSVILLIIALALHAFGIGLRWYILGRIPVANMFEAVTGAAWFGILLALLLVFFFRARVFLLAAHATGFVALLLANQVLPGELRPMMGILDDIMLRLHTTMIIAAYALIFLAAIIAVVYLVGYYATRVRQAMGAETGPGSTEDLSQRLSTNELLRVRPVLAGALPGDEGSGRELPLWLHRLDWNHLIMLNVMFILLFLGGIVLGAAWADYSWGRPWGWDPKEVFALNTWLVYAVLFHIRYVVKNKGVWTAWLSLAGCAMMAFNWWIVNFFIVGLHSYA
jgi:ABC-type transport system involved in cytochrome c biogenesis permease subunit